MRGFTNTQCKNDIFVGMNIIQYNVNRINAVSCPGSSVAPKALTVISKRYHYVY